MDAYHFHLSQKKRSSHWQAGPPTSTSDQGLPVFPSRRHPLGQPRHLQARRYTVDGDVILSCGILHLRPTYQLSVTSNFFGNVTLQNFRQDPSYLKRISPLRRRNKTVILLISHVSYY